MNSGKTRTSFGTVSGGNNDDDDDDDDDDDELDKESAAAAVALIVSNARKGLVALCSAVAQILKEKASLERKLQRRGSTHHVNCCNSSMTANVDTCDDQINSSFNEQRRRSSTGSVISPRKQQPAIEHFKRKRRSISWNDGHGDNCGDDNNRKVIQTTADIHVPPTSLLPSINKKDVDLSVDSPILEPKLKSSVQSCVSVVVTDSDNEYRITAINDLRRQLHRMPIVLSPSPLAGCKCDQCSFETKLEISRCRSQAQMFILTNSRHDSDKPILCINDRICIFEDLIGIVKYIGHLDVACNPYAVYVGVKLDKPQGNTDGQIENKRYFQCQRDCGLFILLHEIRFVVGHAED